MASPPETHDDRRSRLGPSAPHRYRQVLPPRYFPVENQAPVSLLHVRRRTLLWQSLELELHGSASVGSSQFVYWRATDPDTRLAPDVFVHVGQDAGLFDCWKTWRLGPVHLAVEIVDPSQAPAMAWQDQFELYRALGVWELLRFDPAGPESERLRLWDRVDDVLLEREVGASGEYSEVLGLWWVTVADPDLGPVLRIAHDPEGRELVPTPVEREAAERVKG